MEADSPHSARSIPNRRETRESTTLLASMLLPQSRTGSRRLRVYILCIYGCTISKRVVSIKSGRLAENHYAETTYSGQNGEAWDMHTTSRD